MSSNAQISPQGGGIQLFLKLEVVELGKEELVKPFLYFDPPQQGDRQNDSVKAEENLLELCYEYIKLLQLVRFK